MSLLQDEKVEVRHSGFDKVACICQSADVHQIHVSPIVSGDNDGLFLLNLFGNEVRTPAYLNKTIPVMNAFMDYYDSFKSRNDLATIDIAKLSSEHQERRRNGFSKLINLGVTLKCVREHAQPGDYVSKSAFDSTFIDWRRRGFPPELLMRFDGEVDLVYSERKESQGDANSVLSSHMLKAIDVYSLVDQNIAEVRSIVADIMLQDLIIRFLRTIELFLNEHKMQIDLNTFPPIYAILDRAMTGKELSIDVVLDEVKMLLETIVDFNDGENVGDKLNVYLENKARMVRTPQSVHHIADCNGTSDDEKLLAKRISKIKSALQSFRLDPENAAPNRNSEAAKLSTLSGISIEDCERVCSNPLLFSDGLITVIKKALVSEDVENEAGLRKDLDEALAHTDSLRQLVGALRINYDLYNKLVEEAYVDGSEQTSHLTASDLGILMNICIMLKSGKLIHYKENLAVLQHFGIVTTALTSDLIEKVANIVVPSV